MMGLLRLALTISTFIVCHPGAPSICSNKNLVIHWPVAFKAGKALYPPDEKNEGWVELDRGVTLAETWKAMNALPKVWK